MLARFSLHPLFVRRMVVNTIRGYLSQVIESFPNRALALLRSDIAWYLASVLILAAGITIGIFDFRVQEPRGVLDEESKIPHLPNTVVAKPDSETTYPPITGKHWDFFGVPESAPSKLNIEALPETALDLELIGTFTSDAEFSSAVIKTETGDTKRVFLRQPITKGVRLHIVNEKEVVIDRGSVLETLKLYEFDAKKQSVNSPRPSSIPIASNALVSKRPKRASSSGYQNTVEEQRGAMEKRRNRYLAGSE